MGEAKRRRLARERIPYGGPNEFEQPTGSLGIHLIYGDATLNAAVPLADIEETVSKVNGLRRRWDGSDPRSAARQWIVDSLKANEHLDRDAGQAMAITALWLAWTSEIGRIFKLRVMDPTARADPTSDPKMTYLITDVGPGEWNLRLMLDSVERRPVGVA